MVGGYEIAKSIYAKDIIEMFRDNNIYIYIKK